jgi:hypothetical protein
MPLPLALLGLVPFIEGAMVAAGAAGIGGLTYSEAKRYFNRVGPEALQEALDKMGIQIDATHPINDETLTAVINSQFLGGTGVQLESIFDKDKLKKGLAKIALTRAAEKFGFAGVTTEIGFKDALKEMVTAEVMEQLKNEAGPVFAMAGKSKKIEDIIESCRKSDYQKWNDPSDFSDYGIANRARQKKYRDTHKRTWVLRSGMAPAGGL